jgi:hypothetical protein
LAVATTAAKNSLTALLIWSVVINNPEFWQYCPWGSAKRNKQAHLNRSGDLLAERVVIQL